MTIDEIALRSPSRCPWRGLRHCSPRNTRSVAVMKRRRLNFDFLVAQKRRKFLGMHPDGLVCLVKDRKIEIYACLSCSCGKLIAALIGRKYDLGSIGASTKQRRDFIRISMRRQSEIIDFANKFIAFKIADRLIAANANPIWLDRGRETHGSNRLRLWRISARLGTATRMVFALSASAIQYAVRLLPVPHGMIRRPRAALSPMK